MGAKNIGIYPDFNLCASINLVPDNKDKDRIIINTPFIFDDGDVIKVVLKKVDDVWYFTDEGHTFMHLSYDDLDLTKPTRKELLEVILRMHYITNDRGELKTEVEDNLFSNTLFTFLQGLNKIADLSFTRKEHIKSLFFEEFESFLKTVLGDKALFNYIESEKDPKGKYKIDCCIPTRRPVFIFGVPTADKCRDTTITLLKFTTWGSRFSSIIIYEDEEKISSRAVARLSDTSDKSFSSLETAKEGLQKYLAQTLAIKI